MRKADIWKRFPGRKGGREGEREEMGSGEPLTVFGEEKREEKTIGFWINDHSLQESISRRLYLERGNGN